MTKQLEPVCWLCSQEESLKIEWCKDDLTYWIRRGWDVEPLYTKLQRKPMTKEEIVIEFTIAKNQWTSKSKAFEAGVRFAEKHHKIGDEE